MNARERRNRRRSELGNASAAVVRAMAELDSAYRRSRGFRRSRIGTIWVSLEEQRQEISLELDRLDAEERGCPF